MTAINRLLLPVGLPIVVLVGLFLPGPGRAVGALSLGSLSFSDCCVILIFLVNGLQVRLAGARERALVRALVIVLLINLLLAPLLGAAVVRLLDLPLGMGVAIALMASVPTTLSSAAVISVNAGGDRAWALTLTIVTVIIGAFTAPLAISAILAEDVPVDPWPVLQDVLVLVLVPTFIGYTVRKLFWPEPWHWLDPVPSLAILAVVWVTVSKNAEVARELAVPLLLAMAVIAAAIHGALLGIAHLTSRHWPTRQALPVLFVASQKTLPVALAILAILAEREPKIAAVAGVTTICCVIWHFLQLFGDSVLAHRMAATR